jgi:geranylgeranyl diphosphate synthase type II
LWQQLKSRQQRVESALRATLQRTCAEVPESLAEAIAYSLLAPGKRLRPLLAILACEACGGTIERALPAACALEMVHTYSLVHDDLPAMDDDDLRRGLPTCHKKFGEALAILAGDALLTLAFEVIAESYEPRTAAVSCLELARGAGAAGMVSGQVLDLAAEGRIAVSRDSESSERSAEASLEAIHRRKTGALFRSSLRLGVYATQVEAGVKPDDLAAADEYAAAFGLAFQITDDLLDVESTAEKTGKRVNKDAARGKLTFPGLLGASASRARANELRCAAVLAAEKLGSPMLAGLAGYVVDRDR